MMNTSRRNFLTTAGALAGTALAAPAFAQDVLSEVFNNTRRGGWSDQFDARATGGSAPVVSDVPIYSPETLMYSQQAVLEYQNIVAQGGWNRVPDGNKLQLGVVHPDVEALRRRLMISGDLAQRAGLSQSFDTYADAALKRFQRRHGLPADGVTGKYTYAAMNVSAQVRLGQLQTNLNRLNQNMGNYQTPRYVMVNIPAAQIEAVESGRVVSRHTAIVGKIDRQTPILDSAINEVIVNPYWNAPESIIRKDIIPLMRKNPRYLEENHIKIFTWAGEPVDPLSIDWNTEEAAKLHFRQEPGKINAMASTKINFPNSHAVYMHDTPQQSLFNNLMRFDSSGCVRVQNVRDLVTWLLRDTDGWSRQRFEDTIRSGQNTPVQLTNPVPVHFTYVSAWSTGDGVVHFRDDVYALDGAQELQMSQAI
jgi:murein L,D-transpeptidase YcbB/YkuD